MRERETGHARAHIHAHARRAHELFRNAKRGVCVYVYLIYRVCLEKIVGDLECLYNVRWLIIDDVVNFRYYTEKCWSFLGRGSI